MEIGQVINALIKKRGLTQREVASRIGKSTTALSQIVKGAYKPNPETLSKISDVLEVPEPILYFMTISEKDIPEDKLDLYQMLAPTLKEFLMKIFGEQSVVLSEELDLN